LGLLWGPQMILRASWITIYSSFWQWLVSQDRPLLRGHSTTTCLLDSTPLIKVHISWFSWLFFDQWIRFLDIASAAYVCFFVFASLYDICLILKLLAW
jgi:hypothetical protein